MDEFESIGHYWTSETSIICITWFPGMGWNPNLRDQSSSDRNKRLDGINSDEQNVEGWELDHFEIHVKVKAVYTNTGV